MQECQKIQHTVHKFGKKLRFHWSWSNVVLHLISGLQNVYFIKSETLFANTISGYGEVMNSKYADYNVTARKMMHDFHVFSTEICDLATKWYWCSQGWNWKRILWFREGKSKPNKSEVSVISIKFWSGFDEVVYSLTDKSNMPKAETLWNGMVCGSRKLILWLVISISL